jgi:RNA polymerase sigma factor (sigma-70 family)
MLAAAHSWTTPLGQRSAAAGPRKTGLDARRGGIVRLVASSGGSAKGRAAASKPTQGRAKTAQDGALDEERARERAVERELCQRAKEGDKRALAQLLRKHGPTLYRAVLLPRLGSEAAAQDALADTYMRVVERFDQFEWRGCGVYPWLRVIAMRIALDQLRGRKRETLFEPQDLTRAVENAEKDLQQGIDDAICEKQDREEAREKLHAALATINSRYATAIRLRVLEEKSREEAAEALGVTVSTFDVVLHRALKSLKKAITAREDAS